MTAEPTPTGEVWESIPANLRTEIADRLAAGEVLRSALELDLDADLRYARGLLLLTDRRIGSWTPGSGESDEAAPPSGGGWRWWPLDEPVSLECRQHGTVGRLELVGAESRLACWRFTAGKSAAVRRFVDHFERLRRGHPIETGAAEGDAGVCVSCGAAGAVEGFCPKCSGAQAKIPARALFRLVRFARPHAGMVLLGLVLAIASTGAGLVPPYLTMPLLDNVLIPYQSGEPVQFSLVWWYLGGLGGAALLAWLLTWSRTYVLAWVFERVAATLRNETYAHLQRLSLEFFGGKRTGDLIARVSSDTDRICYFLSVYVLDFATDVLMITMTAAILVSIDLYLALATLVPLPLIAYLVHRVRSKLRRGFQAGSRAWGEMTSVLADTIPGIRVVKAFAQERREIERFRRANDRVLAANDRVNTTWSFFGPVVVLLTDAGMLIVWAFGVWQVYNHHVTVGVLTAFVAYITRFYARLDSMSRMVSAVQRAAASTQRIFAILDRAPTVSEAADPVHPGELRGEIELCGVSFRYGSRNVLEGVDLHIRPGEMIGLVGPSGAGKTTLANLVCRFYDVTGGAIRVDGTDIRSFAIEEYRQHIGIVLQEPFLFFGTIAENIAYGRPDATREQIVAAAKAARAHEFILRLPDGYDSLVGERGQSLSGGERQRISIARALLIDPTILILDEATSSVDTETEREIQLALENLVRGRTTIAIAHRLSTLRRADRLVVIERGRIAEIGPHVDLMNNPTGTYARLFQAQLETAAGRAAQRAG